MNPLVSATWLEARYHQNDVVVLYTRMGDIITGMNESLDGMIIPGARLFDFENDFVAENATLPHTHPDEFTFEQEAKRLGLNNTDTIVVYDTKGIFSSARVWYMLRSMGHLKCAILDGGLSAWTQRQLKTLSQPVTDMPVGNFTAQNDISAWCDKETILKNIGSANFKVIDARSQARFEGKAAEPRDGVRSGHIPGSINMPFTDVLSDGCLKSATELKRLFERAGVKKHDQLIFSCGSGVTACVLALAAHVAGYTQISVYDGSWTEWGGDNTLPIQQSSQHDK
ncbi:sulfurtransferase [Alteromonas oceanisediminis]|uniref:sulfurtransferase n=1 Tax=Alteromonas oceanisediminis TaxID=2836180 RepID=UPI001BDA42C5|nr:sulfurtransferase [Alteromonas oceanisediminis]MBT0586333.1 sulfurtransferase [Alteromonas oceanisediminis]